MKKILLTGGSSMIGQSIIKTSPCDIDAPPRSRLDLSKVNSLEKFDYSAYDCLILNAGVVQSNQSKQHITQFTQRSSKEIKNMIDVNCAGNLILIKKFLEKYASNVDNLIKYELQHSLKKEFSKKYGKNNAEIIFNKTNNEHFPERKVDATIVYIGSRSIYNLSYYNIAYATSKLLIDRAIETLQQEYRNINFIRINPGSVNSRNKEHKDSSLSPDSIASAVWYAIDNHINKLDIFEDC